MSAQWTMEEAQSRLPELVRAACNGQPQFIENSDCAETVLISRDTWQQMSNEKSRPSFKEMLLSIPKGEPFLDDDRSKVLNPRDVEF